MKMNYKHTRYASYLGYITQAIVNNLAPLLFFTFQKQFGFSLEKIGFLISVNFLLQIVVDLLAAKIVDRIGYRPCVVAAHIFCTIGVAGLGIFPLLFSNPYSGLLCAVLINSVGGGLIEVLISPIVEALPGDEKASAMSLLHSFYCWGQAGVVLLSTLYFTVFGTDNWAYLPPIWALLPLFNVFLFTRVPLCKLTEEEHRTPMKKLFRLKLFWLFLLLMICSGAAEQAISQWASLFAEAGLHVPKTAGDLLGPCSFALLMGVSRLYYGKKGSKIDLKKFILYSSVLCIASYLLVIFSPIPILSLVGCALCGLSVGIMWPGTTSLSSEYCPQGGTAMFALLALAGDIGCSLGPNLVGTISNAVEDGWNTISEMLFPGLPLVEAGLKTGLLTGCIFPIIMFLIVFLIHKKRTNTLSQTTT